MAKYAKKVRIYDELKEALLDARAYERGEALDLRVTRVPPPPKRLSPADIRALRQSLHASQATFARLINVSTNTVESWEQGARRPQAAALKLLHVALKHPEVLLRA